MRRHSADPHAWSVGAEIALSTLTQAKGVATPAASPGDNTPTSPLDLLLQRRPVDFIRSSKLNPNANGESHPEAVRKL